MAYQITIPTFALGSVPVSVAAKVYGKDQTWVRAGIINGWLPIGNATRGGRLVTDTDEEDAINGRINFYISPRKLWEETGFVWKGHDNGDEHTPNNHDEE